MLAADLSLQTIAGRSTSPVFNLQPALLALPAHLPAEGQLHWSVFLTISQGFSNGTMRDLDNHIYSFRFLDYEAYALEYSLEYGLGQGMSLGFNSYGLVYAPGICDDLVQNFHYLFGFPNNWRQAYPQNQVYIHIPLADGSAIQANTSTFVPGDIQFFYGIALLSQENLNFSFRLYLNIAPPAFNDLMRSRSPGLSPALYFNHQPVPGFIWYLSTGLYLGADLLNAAPAESVNFSVIAGIALELGEGLALGVDCGFKTTSVASQLADTFKYETLTQPNADIFVGLHWRPVGANGRFSLLVQEDPFSHNAADVGLSLGYSAYSYP